MVFIILFLEKSIDSKDLSKIVYPNNIIFDLKYVKVCFQNHSENNSKQNKFNLSENSLL